MGNPLSIAPIAATGRRIASFTARTWQADKAGDDLTLLHRLAVIYLVTPLIVWLVTWFHWWLGIPAAILIVLASAPMLSGSFRFSLPSATAVLPVFVAVVWVMSTAAGGLFDTANLDWNKHRSILLNLADYSWPAIIPDPLAAYLSPESDSPLLIRYYLGWYIVPGAIARLLGHAALNFAVPIWTSLGVGLILLILVRQRRGWGVVFAILIFVFFSGMDFLRVILLEGIDGFSSHIEWAGLWQIKTQYSANMTSLMWTPQHFIAGGLYIYLLLQLARHPRFLRSSPVLLSAALFWSPLIAIGLLPFVAAMLWSNGLRPFLNWSNLTLAVALTGLTAIYLTSGSLDHEQGWIWEAYDWPTIARWIPTFYLTECLLLVPLLWVLRPSLLRQPFFIAAVSTLTLLPLYHYGDYNDLTMRASVPAILVLCYYCIDTLSVCFQSTIGRASQWRKRLAMSAIAVILAIGAVTAVAELRRSNSNTSVFRYEQSFNTITSNVLPDKWDQYAVNTQDIPDALLWFLNTNRFFSEDLDDAILPESFQVFSKDTLATLAAARQAARTEQRPVMVAGGDHDEIWVRYIFWDQSESKYIRTFDYKRSIIFPADPRGASYLFAFELPDPSIMDRYFDQPSAETVGTAPSGRPIILHRLLNPLPPFDPDSPVRAQFGDHILLYGFDMPDNARAGTIMTVRWYWRILTSDQWELAFSNQLFGWDGDRRGQLDDRPFAPNYWPAGTSGISTFEIDIDPETPTGAYWLRAAAYDRGRQDTSNLPIFDPQGNHVGGQLTLGPIKVHGRPPAPSSEGLLPGPPSPDNFLPANFGDQIGLLGYNLEDRVLTPGASFELKLYWTPRGRPTQDYTVFVHLLDSEGQLRSQADSPPTSGKYPTSVWDAGEFIADLHTLSIAPDLPAGEYRVAIGLYDPHTGQRLQILDGDGTPTGDFVTITGMVVDR